MFRHVQAPDNKVKYSGFAKNFSTKHGGCRKVQMQYSHAGEKHNRLGTANAVSKLTFLLKSLSLPHCLPPSLWLSPTQQAF